MTWMTDTVARLKANGTVSALVSTRIYPQIAPASGNSPPQDLIVLSRISANPVDSHDGASGLVAEQLQVSCMGDTHAKAQAIADAVRGSIDGVDGTIGSTTGVRYRRTDERDIPDLDASNQQRQVYGIQQDYEVWHQE